jgi:hypothetical protein
VKRLLADRGDPRDFDAIDSRARRSVPTPRNDAVDGIGRAFELALDRTITAVAYPAADTLGTRVLATRIAEPHTLHPACDDNTHADARGLSRHTWHASQKNVERFEYRSRWIGRRQR